MGKQLLFWVPCIKVIADADECLGRPSSSIKRSQDFGLNRMIHCTLECRTGIGESIRATALPVRSLSGRPDGIIVRTTVSDKIIQQC